MRPEVFFEIMRQLKFFSRKGRDAVEPVDLHQAMGAALELLGYSSSQTEEIVSYAVGHGTIGNAPAINHTTLAGHEGAHDIWVSSVYGKLGSIDSNTGDTLLGWDTDNFPMDVAQTTAVMGVVLNKCRYMDREESYGYY